MTFDDAEPLLGMTKPWEVRNAEAAYSNVNGSRSIGSTQGALTSYASTIPSGGFVSHWPRVKSGKSIGRLLSATDHSES